MYKFAQEDAVNPYNDPTDRMITAGLIGAGIGGLGGYFLPSDESENDTEDERFEKKLKNALIGMGVGGVAGAGLGYGTTELQRLREEKKIKNEQKLLRNTPTSVLSGGIGALVGGGIQAGTDLKYHDYVKQQALEHNLDLRKSKRALVDFLESKTSGIPRKDLAKLVSEYSKGNAKIDASALGLSVDDFNKLGLDKLKARTSLDKLIKQGPKVMGPKALRAWKIGKGGMGGGFIGAAAGLTLPALIGDQFEVS